MIATSLIVAALCVCLGLTARAVQHRLDRTHIPRASDYVPLSNVRRLDYWPDPSQAQPERETSD